MRAGMPRPVRAVVAIISEMADRYCPGRKYPLMAGYLFLRLVNPCLAAPQSHGILPNEFALPRSALQNLLVISKVLQHLSNNSRYAQYPMLERWIGDMQPRMEEFLDQVVFDESGADPPFSDQLPVEPDVVNPSLIDPVALYDLYGILSYHKGALLEVKSRLEQSGSDALVEVYDELLSAMSEAVPQSEESTSFTSGSTATDQFDFEDSMSGPLSPRTVAAATTPREGDSSGGVGRAELRDSGRAKKSADLGASRKGNLVGNISNMKDKAMKLMSKTKNNSVGAAVAPASPPPGTSPTQVSGKSALKDFVLNRLDLEDLSLTSNVALFLLVRSMMNKKDGVQVTSDRHAFAGCDAVSWLSENLNLSHRGNALVCLRMAQESQLIVRADSVNGSQRDARVQDDGTLFVISSARFRLWDSFVGRGDNAELDVISSNVATTCARVLAQNLRGAAIDDVVHHNMEGLSQLALYLHSTNNSSNRVEVQTAQEWLVLFGQMSHEHSIDVLRVLLKARLILPGSFGADVRDIVAEDAVLLLNCVCAAFCNQHGKHAKSWNRSSLVQLLAGSHGEANAVEAVRSEFGIPDLRVDQTCGASDFHASVQSQVSRLAGRNKSADYWMGLWQKLEDCEFLRVRHIVRVDAATQRMTEIQFWYLSSSGTDYLLEHQSCVPLYISFGDGVMEAAEQQQSKAMASSQSRFFNIAKRAPSSKQPATRRSGTFEDDWQSGNDSGSDMEMTSPGAKRSPRSKLLARTNSGATGRKPPPPNSPAPVPPLQRSSSYGQGGDPDGAPTSPQGELSRSDGVSGPVLARPQRNQSPRSSPFAKNMRSSAASPSSVASAHVRTTRTNSANANEVPSVRPMRTNSNTNP